MPPRWQPKTIRSRHINKGAVLAFAGKKDAAAHMIRMAIEQNYCSLSALENDPLLTPGLSDRMNGKSGGFRLRVISSLRKGPPFTMLGRNRNYNFNQSAGIRIAHSQVSTKMSGAFSHATEADSDPIRS
jgi:hypothetical protein